MLLREDLADLMPMVNEANAISQELDKKVLKKNLHFVSYNANNTVWLHLSKGAFKKSSCVWSLSLIFQVSFEVSVVSAKARGLPEGRPEVQSLCVILSICVYQYETTHSHDKPILNCNIKQQGIRNAWCFIFCVC